MWSIYSCKVQKEGKKMKNVCLKSSSLKCFLSNPTICHILAPRASHNCTTKDYTNMHEYFVSMLSSFAKLVKEDDESPQVGRTGSFWQSSFCMCHMKPIKKITIHVKYVSNQSFWHKCVVFAKSSIIYNQNFGWELVVMHTKLFKFNKCWVHTWSWCGGGTKNSLYRFT